MPAERAHKEVLGQTGQGLDGRVAGLTAIRHTGVKGSLRYSAVSADSSALSGRAPLIY
jgi:hypothetical protein